MIENIIEILFWRIGRNLLDWFFRHYWHRTSWWGFLPHQRRSGKEGYWSLCVFLCRLFWQNFNPPAGLDSRLYPCRLFPQLQTLILWFWTRGGSSFSPSTSTGFCWFFWYNLVYLWRCKFPFLTFLENYYNCCWLKDI